MLIWFSDDFGGRAGRSRRFRAFEEYPADGGINAQVFDDPDLLPLTLSLADVTRRIAENAKRLDRLEVVIAELGVRLEQQEACLKQQEACLRQQEACVKQQAAQLKQLGAWLKQPKEEEERTKFIEACEISVLGVMYEQAIKHGDTDLDDTAKRWLFRALRRFALVPWSWMWLPEDLLDPDYRGKLTRLSSSFFRALGDQDIEFQPVHRIIQDYKTALKDHLRKGKAHWKPFRATCHEILVSVGRVSPSRADRILAGIPPRCMSDYDWESA